MLSLNKPLKEFAQLDKSLSKFGTRFEYVHAKHLLYSTEKNPDTTVVILEGIISLRRNEHILVGIAQAPFIMGLSNGVMKMMLIMISSAREYVQAITCSLHKLLILLKNISYGVRRFTG